MNRDLARLCAAFLFWSGHVQAWESDVHYGLTKWLALQAGFKPEYAEALAFANENMDRTAASAVHLVVNYACIRKDESMSNMVKEHHFPTFGKVPGPPADRKVDKDSKAAGRLVKNELSTQVDPAVEQERLESLRRFGEALHAFQDSWSHQGVPDTPGGLPGLICDEKLAWGHPKPRGGYSNTWADHTYCWPADASDTSTRTYEVLLAYLKANNWAVAHAAQPWPQIRKDVEVFDAAKYKDDKSEWFAKRGFKDVSFLRHTSLEYKAAEFPDSAIYARADDVIPLPKTVLAAAGVPKDISDGFTKFFESWLVKNEDIGKLIVPLQMASGMGLEMFEKTEDRTRAVVEDLYLWRLKNFGAATRLMAERRATRKLGMTAAMALEKPRARAVYERVRDAFQPLGPDKLPLFMVALPQPVVAPGGMGDGKAYAAIGKLRHTANTAIVVVGTKALGGLRVIGFGRYAMH